MKRFTKIALILSLILVILGSTFCMISLGIGFSFRDFWKGVEAGEYSIGPIDLLEDGWNWMDDDESWSSSETEKFDFQWQGDEGIEKLDVKVYYGTVNIVENTGDTDKIQVKVEYRKKNHRREIKVYKDGTALKLEEVGSKHSIRNDSTKITIQIPAEREDILKEISLEQDAGEIFVDMPLTAEKININVNAGECQTSEKITAFQEFQAKVDAGEMDLDAIEAKELTLDANVGEISTGELISEDVQINCGVGQIETQLSGREEDYSYQIKCSVGEVEIGENTYSGLGSQRKIDNPGNKKLEVECGVGEVEVSFTQSSQESTDHHQESSNHHQ